MGKQIKIILCFFFFTWIFSPVNAQDGNYCTLKFAKEDIIKMNLVGFTEFRFHFKWVSTRYILVGEVIKTGSTEPLFQIDMTNPPKCHSFKNIEQGVFVLTKKMLTDHGVDGKFDCFLKPKKYKEGTPQEQDYVSYRFKVNNLKKPSFMEFDIDPSPPAK